MIKRYLPFGNIATWKYLRGNSYLSKKKRLLYIATPKVACTSLKWWFADLEGHAHLLTKEVDSEESDPDLVIHDFYPKVAPHVTGLSPEQLTEPLVSEEYFRFAVVRNPFKRIFSAWQSKILLQEPIQSKLYSEKAFFSMQIKSMFDIKLAFESFLEYLMEQEAPSYLDYHWTPQFDLLRPDLISYSNLSKIENTKQLEDSLIMHLGLEIQNPFNYRRANESLISYSSEVFTQRASELILKLYKKDFEYFDYPTEIPIVIKNTSESELKTAIQAIEMIRGRHTRLNSVLNQKVDFNKKIIMMPELKLELDTTKKQVANLKLDLEAVYASSAWKIGSFIANFLKFFPKLLKIEKYFRYKEDIKLIRQSALFDEDWYINKYAKLLGKMEPAAHYLLKGGFEGQDPGPNFSSSNYLKENDDIRITGINPLLHYLRYGKEEGRQILETSTIIKYNKIEENEIPSSINVILETDPHAFRKLKIVLVVHQYFPTYSSGTEVLTYETANALRNMGHDVIVFTGEPVLTAIKDNKRFDRYYHDGIRVERFYHGFVPMGGQTNVLELEYKNNLVHSYFREFLLAERPDVVHFFHLSRLSALPVDACYELGVPTVLTPTDFWFICPTSHLKLPDNSVCQGPDKNGVNCIRHMVFLHQFKKIDWLFKRMPDWLIAYIVSYIRKGINFDRRYSPIVRALVERTDFLQERLNLIDRVVVPTKVMMSSLVSNGLNTQKALFYPYGLNLKHLETVKKTESKDRLRIGYIGTLYEHKGVHILVEAVKKLKGQPLEASIYGNMGDFPNYVAKLQDIAADDTRIKFCGTFPNREIGDVFSNLDVLVVPSLWHENAPLVIYSAQAAKCPVIASNMAGMSEVIEHGKNGLLFPVGDVDALASTIEELIVDSQILIRLSENARKPNSIEMYSEKLLSIYHQLIDEDDIK
ncbi:MAG: glycosyltransferase [Anaerolineales bacterium]